MPRFNPYPHHVHALRARASWAAGKSNGTRPPLVGDDQGETDR